MDILLVVLMVMIALKLIVIGSMAPHRSRMSRYELERRVKIGDDDAVLALSREKFAPIATSILRLIEALLIMAFTMLSLLRFGWFYGSVGALTLVLLYMTFARLPFLRHSAQKLYDRAEQPLLTMYYAYPWLGRFFGNCDTRVSSVLASQEELLHLLSKSTHVISHDDVLAIRALLTLDSRHVEEIMTERSKVKVVQADDILGPLVLDDLHKTGHSNFPVIDKDIDAVLGILSIDNLFTLKHQESAAARDVMDTRVCYVRRDHSLAHALAACVAGKQPLLIVVDQYQQTEGIVSLRGILDALLGDKLAIDFRDHESRSAVAHHTPPGARLDVHRHDI